MLVDAENLSRVVADFSEGNDGLLRVATTHTQARYTLPPVIARFKEAFPNVRLNLQQASPKDLATLLLEGNADIAIATDALDDHPGLIAFPYHTWDHAAVVPRGHPLTKEKALSLATIAEWPIITYDDGLTGRQRIDRAFEAAGVSPDISITALDADVIKAYAELGMGVGVIASIAYDREYDRKLVKLDAPHLFEPSTSSIPIRRGRLLRRYAYRFIEHCNPDITEQAIRSADSGEEEG